MKKLLLSTALLSAVFLFTHCRQEALFRGQSKSNGKHEVPLAATGASLERATGAVSASNKFSVKLLFPKNNPMIREYMSIIIGIQTPAGSKAPHYQIKYTTDKWSGSDCLINYDTGKTSISHDKFMDF